MNLWLALFGALIVIAAAFVYSTVTTAAQGRSGPTARLGIRLGSVPRDKRTWTRGHAAAVLPARTGLIGSCVLVALSLFWVRVDETVTATLMLAALVYTVLCLIWALARATAAAARE